MKLKRPPTALYMPSRDELAELDKLEDDDIEAALELNFAADDVVTTNHAIRESREAALDGELSEWDGGLEIILAALEEAEPGWRWSEQRIVGYHDEDWDDPIYDWEMPPLPVPPKLTPEEKAARDRATEEELLASERELFGPYHVDRNSDPSRPVKGSQWLAHGKNEKAKAKPKGGRKSRKKPVFWSPKKVD
ncbi:hypothetical protein [Bradyrhizobium vignae]|uniref:hypothetical protein n=1 Tax=Bradyrhizobium vignae TaxID=1549949 RepID=UPI00100B109A|nr:hypothetical protein [Bradyrhizobium vignae]RXH06298.1 hypothetical protein EAV90_03845 [Bradyrhizobium vignae]